MVVLVAWIQAGEQVAAAERGIGPFALAFMLASMGAVTLLAAWCFWRILSGRQHFDPDGTGPAHAPVPGKLDQAEGRGPR